MAAVIALGPCARRFWQLLALFAAGIGSAASAGAEPAVKLQTMAAPGAIDRVEVGFQVAGHVKLPGEKAQQAPLSVVGRFVYDERRVRGTTVESGALRSLRHYSEAQAVVKIDTGGEKPTLGTDRRLIGVDYASGRALIFCPGQLLTREELDLVDVPANSLFVEAFLPAEAVATGDRWKPADQLLASLLGLDAVSLCDVECTVGEVTDETADIAMGGFVGGAIAGVATEIELKGKFRFDRAIGRITWFAMVLREKRAIGHVGPGLDVTAKVTMQITPNAASAELSEEAVAKMPAFGAAEAQALSYELPRGRFRLAYDRRWHVTSAENTSASLRLVDRGDFIAQCNIAALADAPAGQPTTLAEFQRDIQQALDKTFGQFVSARETTDADGRTIYRVVVLGEVSDLPIQWMYYLIRNEAGKRLSVSFTLEPELLPRFADADARLIAALQLVDLVEPADEPTPAEPPATAERLPAQPKR